MRSDEDVYRANAADLTRFANALVGPDDAPDIVTDAVLAAFATPRWPEIEDRRAYLFRAVLNRARSHHRSASRRRQRERLGGVRLLQPADLPESSIDALQVLDMLTPQQRSVAYLTYWEDLTSEAIADLLGIAPGTVRKQLARARDRLRKELRHD